MALGERTGGALKGEWAAPRGARELKELVVVELHELGAAQGEGHRRRGVERRAEVQIDGAKGMRPRADELGERVAVGSLAERERPVNQRLRRRIERKQGGRRGDAIPGHAAGDGVGGRAGPIERGGDGAGRDARMAGDEMRIQ